MSVHNLNQGRQELAQLRAHLRDCVFGCGRVHRLQCIAETLDAFLAPRFVSVVTVMTTVVVVGTSLAI